MYYMNGRIRYSETDANEYLTPEGILNYFQDCSTFQSEDIGFGVEKLKEEKIFWVLNFWQIVIKRRPRLGEKILVGTLPYEFKSSIGFRNFILKTEKGEELAIANSIWTLLNKENHFTKVSPEMEAAYRIEDRLEMDYAPRKIEIPKEEFGNYVIRDAIEIKKHHLDSNFHVNNGQYVKFAIDFLPENVEICEIRAEYKMQAVLGDIIIPKIYLQENKYTITLNNTDNKVYATIQLFIKEDIHD